MCIVRTLELLYGDQDSSYLENMIVAHLDRALKLQSTEAAHKAWARTYELKVEFQMT